MRDDIPDNEGHKERSARIAGYKGEWPPIAVYWLDDKTIVDLDGVIKPSWASGFRKPGHTSDPL